MKEKDRGENVKETMVGCPSSSSPQLQRSLHATQFSSIGAPELRAFTFSLVTAYH